MNDLEQLADRLTNLADAAGGRTPEDIFDAAVAESSSSAGGPHRRRYSALAVAAALVLVVGVASWRIWDGGDSKLVTTPAGPTDVTPDPTAGQSTAVAPTTSPASASTEGAGSSTTSAAVEPGPTSFSPGWTDLPPTPGPLSNEVVAVPDGVLGFYQSEDRLEGYDRTDQAVQMAGAYYDYDAGVWAEVRPIENEGAVPSRIASVWTGQQVIVIGSLVDTGGIVLARWTPGEEGFVKVSAPEVESRLVDEATQFRWTIRDDRAVLLISSLATASARIHQLWEYDPVVDSWERLVDPPTTSDLVFGFEWTGEQLLVVSGVATDTETLYDGIAVIAHRPGALGWTKASKPPELSGQAAGSAWDGQRLVVVSYDPSAAAYDPTTDTWTSLEAPPIQTGEGTPSVVALADGTVAALLFGQVASLPAGRTEGWTVNDSRLPGPSDGSAWGQTIVVSEYVDESRLGGSNLAAVFNL